MPVHLMDPDGLPDGNLYQQVSVATGSTFVHVAGQVAVDGDGALVGEGDLAAQVERAYDNVGTALAAAGATWADVVKVTAYFVDWTPNKGPALAEGMSRAATRFGTDARPPFTGIGVAALAEPGMLVEIEATAVV